jgi:SprT protein
MSNDKAIILSQKIERFVPDGYALILAEYIIIHKIMFKVVKPRATKLGDYRAPFGAQKRHIITINSDLNKFAFLITSLHEIAHLHTYEAYGRNAAPHGIEWKNAFATLLHPLLSDDTMPHDLKLALRNTVKNVKASSCSDTALSRVIQRYDTQKDNTIALENLKLGASFALKGNSFRKGEKRRTRYLCIDTSSQKQYLVHALAMVEIIEVN